MTKRTRGWTAEDKLAFYSEKNCDGCLIWKGSFNDRGYGQLKVEGRLQRAHRLSYELTCGPIPKGLHLDHKCRNRACINPLHLEPVTPLENYRRGKCYGGVLYEPRTFCKNGHELIGSNLYARKSKPNERCCRQCMTEQQRLRRSRK